MKSSSLRETRHTLAPRGSRANCAVHRHELHAAQETVKQLGRLIARRIREYSRAGQGTHSSYRDILTNLKELATGNALLSSFEIRLPYLNDKIIDVEQTIEEAGLTPSAVVVFRRRETRAQRGL